MENKDEILQSLLEAIDAKYDKRPGSFIYDTLASAAVEFAKVEMSIEELESKLSIENLSGAELAQRVKERTGITRRAATRAIGSVTLTGTGTIQIGDLFETPGGIQFQSKETKSITDSGTVTIEAVVAGSGGIVAAGTITLFPVTLSGFTAVTNPEPTQDGFDEESDVDILQRYYERIKTPATSGNKPHYISWAKEVSGVGLAKVFPLWSGNNTVKVVIIDANRQPASLELVGNVQNHLDPNIQGLGEGAAPIGSFVTAESAVALEINISVTIVLSAGYTQQEATDNITDDLTQYLKDIAFVESIVSFAKVGAGILASSGVEDYSNLTVNSSTSNVTIGDEQVAVLGSVTVNVP
jgi:uncharacterized phage protein gp47/JayE